MLKTGIKVFPGLFYPWEIFGGSSWREQPPSYTMGKSLSCTEAITMQRHVAAKSHQDPKSTCDLKLFAAYKGQTSTAAKDTRHLKVKDRE